MYRGLTRCKVSTKALLTKQRVMPGARTLTICMLGEKGFISLRRIKEIKIKSLVNRRYINDEMKM